MKQLFYVLTIWVVLTNGDIWKYPQADYYQPSITGYHLYESSTGKEVIGIDQRFVSKIGYSYNQARIHGYSIYWNQELGFDNNTLIDYDIVRSNGMCIYKPTDSCWIQDNLIIIGGAHGAENAL